MYVNFFLQLQKHHSKSLYYTYYSVFVYQYCWNYGTVGLHLLFHIPVISSISNHTGRVPFPFDDLTHHRNIICTWTTCMYSCMSDIYMWSSFLYRYSSRWGITRPLGWAGVHRWVLDQVPWSSYWSGSWSMFSFQKFPLYTDQVWLVQNCLWTLRNLSDAGTKLENMETLMQVIYRCLMMEQNILIKSGRIDILSILTHIY